MLLLTACGKSGGDQSKPIGAPPGVVDHTPHTYTAVGFISGVPVGVFNTHQVCNFGLSYGFRDEVNSTGLSQPFNLTGGVGAGPCENYTVDIDNGGAYTLIVSITVDGVALPDVTLSPAQHYTFQRGF